MFGQGGGKSTSDGYDSRCSYFKRWSRVQLIEHEKTGARHAEALGCITQFVLPSCAISGAALARADAADAAAATAADAATAAITFDCGRRRSNDSDARRVGLSPGARNTTESASSRAHTVQ